MRFDERRDGDVTVLTIQGELDGHTLPQANEHLDELIAHLRVRLVFNLSAMDLVTSTGISFLIDAARRTRSLGGDVVLSASPPLLAHTLSSLKIADYFRAFPGDAEAVAAFREPVAAEAREPPPPEPPKGWLARLRRKQRD